MGLLIERGPRSPQKKDKELDARRCPYVRQPATAAVPLGRTAIRTESRSTAFMAPSATVFRSFVSDMARQQESNRILRASPRSPGRVVPTRIPSPEVDTPESNFARLEQRRLEVANERRAQAADQFRQRQLRALGERFPYLPPGILETHPPIVENAMDLYDLTDREWREVAEDPWNNARPVPATSEVMPIRRATMHVDDDQNDDEDALSSEQLRQLRRLSQLRSMRLQQDMRRVQAHQSTTRSTINTETQRQPRPIQITYHQRDEA